MPAATATAVESATTATEAGTTARGITAGLAAVVIATEAARTGTGLAAGLIVSPRSLSVPVERRVSSAGIIVNTAVSAAEITPTAAHVVGDAAFASPAVVIVAVVESIAARIIMI